VVGGGEGMARVYSERKDLVEYLRTQAFHIVQLANEIEAGGEVTVDWQIDLKVPELKEEVVKVAKTA
jgi:hypothetical protein